MRHEHPPTARLLLLQRLMVFMCTGDKPAFSKQAVDRSARGLLNRMGLEDVLSDAPAGTDWVCAQSSVFPTMIYRMVCSWTAMLLWTDISNLPLNVGPSTLSYGFEAARACQLKLH